VKATKYRTKIIQFLLLACTLSPHGELSALAKSGKSRKTETEAQILDPAAERQKLIDTLSSDKHSQLASLPILGLACGARDNAVYLWPRERILLGFIVGEYGAILDDTEFSRCQQVINDLQSETARQSVLMARDPLYKNLQDYTIAHFEELKIRAANRQLSSEEFEFLCLIVESLLPSWRMGVSRQEQLNSLGTAFLEAYPNSRFRSEVIPLLHVYERTEAWPTEFALGYGFGAYQGTLRSYLSGLSYVQSDFHFYQRDFFLGWFSKLGFGTSGVRQAFGDSWQSGDMMNSTASRCPARRWTFSTRAPRSMRSRPGLRQAALHRARACREHRASSRSRPALDAYLAQLDRTARDLDFPWFPARVVCHDILGQTALVDLAGLRDAIADQGGDPAQVNPVVPVQLIVDHSLAVECGGFDPDAFAKNRAIEDRRNEDRFHFIDWTKRAFRNVDVIPPATASCTRSTWSGCRR
jgi:hypothetical protein